MCFKLLLMCDQMDLLHISFIVDMLFTNRSFNIYVNVERVKVKMYTFKANKANLRCWFILIFIVPAFLGVVFRRLHGILTNLVTPGSHDHVHCTDWHWHWRHYSALLSTGTCIRINTCLLKNHLFPKPLTVSDSRF